MAKPKSKIEANPEAKNESTPETSEQTQVMLNWKQARLLVIHPSQSGSMASTLTGANSVLTPEQVKQELEKHIPLTILPGIHSYSTAQWNECKDHPNIKAKLADDQLVLITNELVGNKSGKADDSVSGLPLTLTHMSAAQAMELANGCLDKDALKRWLSSEKAGPSRQSVMDAIEAQSELLAETDARFSGERGN